MKPSTMKRESGARSRLMDACWVAIGKRCRSDGCCLRLELWLLWLLRLQLRLQLRLRWLLLLRLRWRLLLRLLLRLRPRLRPWLRLWTRVRRVGQG